MAGFETEKGPKLILVVESSRAQAESLRHMVESCGYRCVIARNGEEGLETLRTVKTALVISDVIMPEMDGFEFCQRVKSDEELKSIPVILLTSPVDIPDIIEGLECGADSFVTKPYEEDYLMARVDHLLVNRNQRQPDDHQGGIEIEFGGKRHLVTSERRQILELLLSTCGQAVQINQKLKRREQELEASNARLAALNAIGVTVSQSLDLDQILNDALAQLAESLEIVRAAVFLLEGEGLALSAERNFPSQLAEEIITRKLEPRLLASAFDDLRHFEGARLEFVPLKARGTVNGLLVIEPSGQIDFLRDGSRLMQGIAHHLAVAVENGRLYVAAQQEREDAEDANRAKDAFLALVTHELRSPLNAMFGWTRVLLTKKVDEEMRRHALEAIEQSARTQSRLIEDLLDTARITSGKMRLDLRPVDLVNVIEAAFDVVRPSATAKRIEVRGEFGPGDHIITGDPDRLQQVVWNLLSNAIKFTPDGGSVTVTLVRADPYMQIAVSDTGKGINPDFLPYVFERFAQQRHQKGSTKRKSGLGLGLSLAKHLIELHGGSITADSPGEGGGATFTVNLPIRAVRPKARDAERVGEQSEASADSELLEGLRVLLVDDEQEARDLVTAVLKQYNAQVTPVASAAEALDALASGESFDVLVSDIGMPEQSGYDLMRKVRTLPSERGGKIPAVALTAFGRSTDRIRALAAGFQMHVPKPVEHTELALVVAGLTGRAGQGKSD